MLRHPTVINAKEKKPQLYDLIQNFNFNELHGSVTHIPMDYLQISATLKAVN